MMLKPVALILMGLALSFTTWSQEYLGWDNLPSPDDVIEELPYFGEANDFSGGIQTGDLCPDFTIYDLNGNPKNLYESLRPDKYTILVSMSQSCVRVIQGFDPNWSPGTVNFMQEFGDQFNWVPIYVEEAHPADIENCPSNCTGTVILSLDGDSIFSHQTYQDRHDLAAEMVFFGNNPDYDFIYPFEEIFLDNPDNGLMVDIFQAPFAMVVLDCAGYVVMEVPFMNSFLNITDNWSQLTDLADQADSDSDDICNVREEFIGTDPFDPCDPNGGDSDGDGLCDILEENEGTDPFDPCDPFVDVDNDDICDYIDEEVDVPPCEEDPTDSDGDGICDGQEAEDGTDPNNPCDPDNTDTDGDGYCDVEEILNGTEPLNPCDPDGQDTDGDGYCDNLELVQGNDPEDPCNPDFIDSDNDGLCNLLEIQNGWNPADACDPDDTDTDNDGICDLQEILDGTDPLVDENAVGVDEVTNHGLRAYPNPVQEVLQLRADQPILQAEVLAANGQRVAFVKAQNQLDTAAWSKGVYTVRVEFADGQMAVLRVIK